MNLPDVVSHGEWEAAQERFREREKEATRAGDALAADVKESVAHHHRIALVKPPVDPVRRCHGPCGLLQS